MSIPAGKYEFVRATYIPLIDSTGTACENCGRVIANIVTVKHNTGQTYIIGQDCAKTLFNKEGNKEIETQISKAKKQISYDKKRIKMMQDLASSLAAQDAKNEGIPAVIQTIEQTQRYNQLVIKHSEQMGIPARTLELQTGYLIYFR